MLGPQGPLRSPAVGLGEVWAGPGAIVGSRAKEVNLRAAGRATAPHLCGKWKQASGSAVNGPSSFSTVGAAKGL